MKKKASEMVTVICALQEKTRFTQEIDKLKAALAERDTVSPLRCFAPLMSLAACVRRCSTFFRSDVLLSRKYARSKRRRSKPAHI